MEIESIDFYYLSMPEVLDIGDGSQDVLLVRARAGEWVGWGECEAAPLVSIASLVAPMSHSACKPVQDSVLGQRLDSPEDIRRIAAEVRGNSFDQLQADHTWSGIDIALWDLLGHRFEEPVHRLLSTAPARPKKPYASILFGADPAETYQRGVAAVAAGYTAVKFGWEGFGLGDVRSDREQLAAAREGIGPDADLLVDAAMAWDADADRALLRAAAFEQFRLLFIEEPFVPGADAAYRALRSGLTTVRTAGGEGCHTAEMAIGMVDHAEIDFVQIDTGRIGGISAARRVAEYARTKGVTFLNHTFTSHLALSASLQPYVDDANSGWCEFPIEPKPVSYDLTTTHLGRNADGLVTVPDAPGLGLEINTATVAQYLVETEITVAGQVLYRTPELHP